MIILTQDEIADLTGRVRYAAQMKVLRSFGLEVKTRPDGAPIVSRANFEKVFGGISSTEKEKKVILHFDDAA